MSQDMTDLKALLGVAAAGRSLNRAEARQAFDIIMSGNATPAQMGGFLMALRVRGETVEEIAPGGIFGEMALIDHAPRSASAVAIEDSEIIPIDERLFFILVQDAPYFALDVMRVLTDRIRNMNQRL